MGPATEKSGRDEDCTGGNDTTSRAKAARTYVATAAAKSPFTDLKPPTDEELRAAHHARPNRGGDAAI